MSNIEDRLDRIERKLDALMAAMKPGATGGARSTPASALGTTSGGASSDGDIDADIDGPRGDPEVRFVPKRWTGSDYKGQKFSVCEPEFLDMLADAYEWFAKRDDEAGTLDKNGSPKSRWSRLDAARARAWSARLRDGGSAPPSRPRNVAPAANRRPAAPSNNGYSSPEFGVSQDNDDIPF